MNDFLLKIVDVGERRALYEEILGAIRSGQISPTVEKSFDLSESCIGVEGPAGGGTNREVHPHQLREASYAGHTWAEVCCTSK